MNNSQGINLLPTITQKDITNYLNSPEAPKRATDKVKNIQTTKQEAIKRILLGNPKHNGSQENSPKKVINYSSTQENLGDSHYLQQFEEAVDLSQKYLFYSPEELKIASTSQKFSPQEKQSIKEYLVIHDSADSLFHKEYTTAPKREVFFDTGEMIMNEDSGEKKENIPCFFEVDKGGIRKYFSLNDLANDLETFGMKRAIPVISKNDFEEIHRYFPYFDRYFRYYKQKKKIADLRDKQEETMYNLKHYSTTAFSEPEKEIKNSERMIQGKIAEYVVEWMFRNFSQRSQEYDIKVRRASIAEDYSQKVDLFLEVRHISTGIKIKKQLQLTLAGKDKEGKESEYLQHKQDQLKTIKEISNMDIDLISLMFRDLRKKFKFWRSFGAPVGGIQNILSFEEKKLLGDTYDRLVTELREKILQQENNQNISILHSPDSEILAA